MERPAGKFHTSSLTDPAFAIFGWASLKDQLLTNRR